MGEGTCFTVVATGELGPFLVQTADVARTTDLSVHPVAVPSVFRTARTARKAMKNMMKATRRRTSRMTATRRRTSRTATRRRNSRTMRELTWMWAATSRSTVDVFWGDVLYLALTVAAAPTMAPSVFPVAALFQPTAAMMTIAQMVVFIGTVTAKMANAISCGRSCVGWSVVLMHYRKQCNSDSGGGEEICGHSSLKDKRCRTTTGNSWVSRFEKLKR